MVTPVKDSDPTIGKLVIDASRDLSTLIRKEIELAKSELKVSITAGGFGAALLGVAAFLGLMALVMLSFGIVWLIHWNGSGLALHWGFLIVTGVYLLIAAILGLVGVKKFKQVKPPEKAIEQGKQIPKAFKG